MTSSQMGVTDARATLEQLGMTFPATGEGGRAATAPKAVRTPAGLLWRTAAGGRPTFGPEDGQPGAVLGSLRAYRRAVECCTEPTGDGSRRVSAALGDAQWLSREADGLCRRLRAAKEAIDGRHGRPVAGREGTLRVPVRHTGDGPDPCLVAVLERLKWVVAFPLDRWTEMERERPGGDHPRHLPGDTLPPGDVAALDWAERALAACVSEPASPGPPSGPAAVKLPTSMRGVRRLLETSVKDDRIVELLNERRSYREIAEQLGCSKSTVGRVAKDRGLTGHAPERVPLEGTLEENLSIRGKPGKRRA